MIHLNKSKVLVIGSTDRLRRRVASLLGELPGVFTSQRAGCAEIELYLAEHRIDAVLLEAAGGFLEDMERIHQTKPAMPIVAYDDDPGYAATRSALLNGAVDVLRIRSATAPVIEPVLRRALDPISHTFADGLRHREQSIRAISRRGENFSQRLVSGDPPQFYMNGNRAMLLRANVLCTGSGLLWRQDAAWAWIQEFGVTNTFLFPSSGSELHLGAIVEQDYINATSYKHMLNGQLNRFYRQLAELNCVCAATYCSSDYLSLSVLHHLDHLVELVFYLDECQTLSDSAHRANTLPPPQLYGEFCTATAVHDVDAAVACVDRAVGKLRSDMPAPDFAREALSRFLWEFASVVGSRADHPCSLRVDDSHIGALRNSIVSIIRNTLSADLDGSPDSPLVELIRRIEANPGLPISIDQAAREINFSRSHFCRLFRQQTGQSFTEFLTQKRIAMACELLKKTGMRVDEISESVGIGNTWYFKKIFQKQMGMSVEGWTAQNRIGPPKVNAEP